MRLTPSSVAVGRCRHVSVAVRLTPASVAVKAACPTALPVTVTRPVALPAGIVTLAGTAAMAGALLVRLTVTPPAGAGPLRVTVAVAVWPTSIWAGLSVSAVSPAAGAATVRVAVRLTPPAWR